jgi:hypothetical protein
MFITWRGHGHWAALLPLFVLFALFGASMLLQTLIGFNPRRLGPYIGVIVLGVSGAIVTVWGFIANRSRPALAIDAVTGHEFVLRTRHSLYGLPMQIWGMVEIAAAITLSRSHWS